MPEICLVVLIGLPAAGKTSFCKEFNRKLSSTEEYDHHTVIYDNIVDKKLYEAGNANLQTEYKELRNRAFAIAEKIIRSVGSSQNNLKKHLVLIDDNMYYKSMRYEYYQLAKKYETSFFQIYFDVLLATAINRNSTRKENQVPESIIRDMARKLEVPGKERWELNSFTLDSESVLNETTLAAVFERLAACIKLPVVHTRVEKKTGTLPVTTQQNIELMLRKIVHKKIYNDYTQADTHVKRKKEIFQNIKDGIIVIDEKSSESDIFNYLEKLF